MLLWILNLDFAASPADVVAVPDVVGETQAQGTIDLEAVGFVVAVVTAYSSVVAAGIIISQDPVAGSTPGTGATVTITVSLGDQPVTAQVSTGGFLSAFDVAAIRRERRLEAARRRKRDEEELAEEAVEQSIAKLLYEQEQKDQERADLSRIQDLADSLMNQKTDLPRPILASVIKAHEERTVNALAQLERLIYQQAEEEEMAILMFFLNDD